MKMAVNLLEAETAREVFREAAGILEIDNPEEESRELVIYEMTDGMRTSTDLSSADAYVDGGRFALRLIHLLKTFGAKSCYFNVIEERHRLRENYRSIFSGLKQLYPLYEKYSEESRVKLRFLGNLEERLEPSVEDGDFASELKRLESKTEGYGDFTAHFLINYSLDWAMQNREQFRDLPVINQIVRHTKFQFPTGMLLPPFLSDFSSCVYVQQGSSGSTWSDVQLTCLIALALRSMVINRGTQYLKKYSKLELDSVRLEREDRIYMRHNNLFTVGKRALPSSKYPPNTKRIIIAGPFGPEIYEF